MDERVEEESQPIRIVTFAEAFKMKRELYHWDKIVFPRPILVSVLLFVVGWEIVFLALTLSGILPLFGGYWMGIYWPVVDAIGRFVFFPLGLGYVLIKIPAQGRSIMRFLLSKGQRWFRPSMTRMGEPVKHEEQEYGQLTEMKVIKEEEIQKVRPYSGGFDQDRLQNTWKIL